MSVIGTPIDSGTTCLPQSTYTVQVTQLYGTSLPTKRRAVSINGGSKAMVQLQFCDHVGNPITLPNCIASIPVRMREVISTCSNDLQALDGSIVDASTGTLSFLVPQLVLDNPGVYNCEVALFDSSDNILFTNQLYVWVNRGLFADPRYPNAGPPNLDEIRLYIRDNAPEENFLLDDFEFDTAEICQAAELGVRYWNEAQPNVGIAFNTLNYVVRDKWMQYIAGRMFQMAAHRFRRNHLPYQAGGISVDDQNKFQQYDQIGMALIQDYRDWVKNKKVEINCYAAMTSSGSPYGSSAYHLLNTGI